MVTENFNDLHIHEIRKEYQRIDNAWLHLHYKISIGLVIFAFIVECLMALIIINSDLLSTTVDRYVLKYILIPSGINFLCIWIEGILLKSVHLTQRQQIYTVSLGFVYLCFVLFAVHRLFTATYFLFVIAVILTTIYTDYRLTCVTAFSGIGALVLTELYIKWDVDKVSIFNSTRRLGDFLVSLFIVIACFFVSLIIISYERKKNEASIQKEMERQLLTQRLQTDELTGVYSRKALHDAMRDMEANEAEDRFIFAIADLDHFKEVNDNLGHMMGDRCLAEFANILKEVSVKESGKFSVFRYGGDEFCLLFRNSDMAEALRICKDIQEKTKAIDLEECARLNITVSFGLTEYSDDLNAARLFVNADQALYEAKRARNTIRVY